MKKKVVHKRYPTCDAFYCGAPDPNWSDRKTNGIGTWAWKNVTCAECIKVGLKTGRISK